MKTEPTLEELDARGFDPFEGVRIPVPRVPMLRERHPSPYHGIAYVKAEDCWMARVKVGNTPYYIGKFKEAEKAAKAYDNARWYLQDFCPRKPKLNFPDWLEDPLPRVLQIRAKLLELGFPNPHTNHFPDFIAPEL